MTIMESYAIVSCFVFLWMILRDMETPFFTLLGIAVFWPVFVIVTLVEAASNKRK